MHLVHAISLYSKNNISTKAKKKCIIIWNGAREYLKLYVEKLLWSIRHVAARRLDHGQQTSGSIYMLAFQKLCSNISYDSNLFIYLYILYI